MAFDAHANFGVSSVAVAPSPATTGTSLTVATGEGTRFPAAPFNATLAPSGVLATPANAEIVRVTARSGDVLTITRAQEGSVARAVVVGDLCVASITAKALQDIETMPYAWTDAANTFTAPQYIQTSPAYLYFHDTAQPVDQRRFLIINTNQTLALEPTTDAAGVPIVTLLLNRQGDVSVGRDLYEKQRTTPLGHWKTYPYSAGNFTANTGTWTVEAGDVTNLTYMLIGKTLFVDFNLLGTSVSGSPTQLRILIPEALSVAVSAGGNPFFYSQDGYATSLVGIAVLTGAYLTLYRDPTNLTAWTTITNATCVRGVAIVSLA
jgi:hypothetical protein